MFEIQHVSRGLAAHSRYPQGTKLGPIGFQILINDALPLMRNPNTGSALMILHMLKATLPLVLGNFIILQEDPNEFSKWSSSNGPNLM